MRPSVSVWRGLAYYGVMGYFTYLMLLITLQYVPIRFDVAFLALKEVEIAKRYYQVAFFSHVYTSIFVLLFGIFQFSKPLRANYSSLHRRIGTWYVFLILGVASPSGFIMAIHANGGFFSQLSFVLQAVLWFGFTYLALHFARSRDWTKHHHFMLRSYALTLSAISLRLFKWIIVQVWELPPMDTYRIVAWLGWVVNLLMVEGFIRYRRKPTT